MIGAATIALLRLVVYAFIVANATAKGYKWLAIAGVYAAAVAMTNFFVHMSAEVLGLLSSGFALLLMMHVLDLRPKVKGGPTVTIKKEV